MAWSGRGSVSIETFHKASLVHDDIEDDDAFGYGEDTVHRRYGIPTAINVGDYLIGMGYRLVSCEIKTLGADVVADILNNLADAHIKLSEGQGSELLWRDAKDKRLKPIDALKIYALKTSPAFEAALYVGVRLAGSADDYIQPIRQFSRKACQRRLISIVDESGQNNARFGPQSRPYPRLWRRRIHSQTRTSQPGSLVLKPTRLA